MAAPRTIAAAVGVFLVAACGSATDPNAKPIEGAYVLTWARSAAVCSPAALPAPTTSDTTRYAIVPLFETSTRMTAQIRQTDSLLTLAPTTLNDRATDLPSLSGVLDDRASAVLARTLVRSEAARADGHAFTVAESVADSAHFVIGILTPPGHGFDTDMHAAGIETFVFHDGGISGPIFTTCTIHETIEGQRPNVS